jgi:hypothetical protein
MEDRIEDFIEDSIEIFRDFPKRLDETTEEQRHQKRLILEKRIFTILKIKYLEPLSNFWNSYKVPKISDRCIVIIERRVHPNLEFIIKNAAYFARGWSIAIVCSDINIEYIRQILKHNQDSVYLIQMFQGNLDPAVGKNEYNYLLQSSEFFLALPSENLLLMEMDTYLRKPVPEEILKYDYVASPYKWNESLSGGGLSFRKRTVMLDICLKYSELAPGQDIYACNGIKALGYSRPSFQEEIQYFCESCLYKDPVGFHQWWTFFILSEQENNHFYKKYMTLEM